MSIPLLQAIAAIMGAFAALLAGMYAVVTRPLLAQIQLLTTGTDSRLAEIIKRLDRIEAKLDNHGDRITRLEERNPPLARR